MLISRYIQVSTGVESLKLKISFSFILITSYNYTIQNKFMFIYATNIRQDSRGKQHPRL